MKSERPKVLHEAAGRPLLAWVVEAARAAGCGRILVVIGHGAEAVRETFAGQQDLVWVEQREQRGTGHALAQAAAAVAAHPSIVFCGARSTARAPAGTSRVITEPAPVVASAPTST
ncbi:MAG: NTP transferase domain-containing protein, partial [Thermoanaerobaculia bacterium]